MFSLLFFLVSSLGCVLTANTIPSDPDKILDIVISRCPKIDLPYISDVLIAGQVALTIAVIDKTMFSEICLLMCILQFFRILCMASTVLPPLKTYEEKYRLGGLNGSGTEYIFSGHACYSAVTTIYLWKLGVVPVGFLVFYNLVSQFLIILTHNHYTVDIVLAWIIAPLLYGNLLLCQERLMCSGLLEKVI